MAPPKSAFASGRCGAIYRKFLSGGSIGPSGLRSLLKPGDSYQVPPVAIHDARTGDKGAKIFAVCIVERGKPLASPAN